MTVVKALRDVRVDDARVAQETIMTPFLMMVLAGYAVFVVGLAVGQIQCAMASANPKTPKGA